MISNAASPKTLSVTSIYQILLRTLFQATSRISKSFAVTVTVAIASVVSWLGLVGVARTIVIFPAVWMVGFVVVVSRLVVSIVAPLVVMGLSAVSDDNGGSNDGEAKKLL